MYPKKGDVALYLVGSHLVDVIGNVDQQRHSVPCSWTHGRTFVARHLHITDLFVVPAGTSVEEAIMLAGQSTEKRG